MDSVEINFVSSSKTKAKFQKDLPDILRMRSRIEETFLLVFVK